MKNDNHVLAEFARDVRAAGVDEHLPLPWNNGVRVGGDHQAAIVALFENGLLGYKAGKLYCSHNTNSMFRLNGVLGSILESILIVIGLLTVLSIGTRSSDFLGMLAASSVFIVLMMRGLRTSRYFHLYAKVPVDADYTGRIRNALMFLCSWFAAALAVYFYRRIFVHDFYADGSLSLLSGVVRAIGDGVWWDLVGEGILGIQPGGAWWHYALVVIPLSLFYLALWFLLWGVTITASNADASNQLLASTGMLQRYNAYAVAFDDRSAQGRVALYSSLVALVVFFYSIHFYEGLARSLF